MLDPKVRSWRDTYLQNLIAKDNAIKEAETRYQSLEAERLAAAAKLAEFEKRERERAEAEMTELQKYQTRLSEAEQQHQTLKAQMDAHTAAMAQKEAEWQAKQRFWGDEAELITTLNAKGIFPNAYEREGLKYRIQQMEYANQEERVQKISGLVDTFISETQRQTTPNQQQQAQDQAAIVQNAQLQRIPVPPGGNPASAPKLLEDNYGDFELRQLSKTDPEKYRAIAKQRSDLATARGAMMIKRKFATE